MSMVSNKYMSMRAHILKTFYIMLGVWMEQRALKNVNNCLNTTIYYYLETSGGQSSRLYLNVVHFFDARVNKTSMAA